MLLDGRPRRFVELTIQIGGNVPPGTPAAQGLGEAGLASLVVLGERAHEQHPAPPQALLGRRKARGHRPGDLHGRPAEHIVEHNCDSVDDRQPGQRILELVTELGALEHSLRSHRVPVILPVGLDCIDVELVVMGARAVDDAVDEAPPEPRAERGRVAELVPAPPGAHDGLLRAVLRLVGIADQAGREVHKPRELGRERGREFVLVGLPVDRQFDPRDVAQCAFDFVLTRRSA